MLARPLSSLSRILLAVCAVGLGSSSLYGQDSPSTPTKPVAAAGEDDIASDGYGRRAVQLNS